MIDDLIKMVAQALTTTDPVAWTRMLLLVAVVGWARSHQKYTALLKSTVEKDVAMSGAMKELAAANKGSTEALREVCDASKATVAALASMRDSFERFLASGRVVQIPIAHQEPPSQS